MNIAICGYPRSGSTMLYNMLRSTVTGYSFTDRELSAVHALPEMPWPAITKFPSDCFYWREIRGLDPEARFVVTIRDPRSVLCSKHATTGDLYKVSWDRTYFGKPMKSRLQRRRRARKQNQPGRYRSKWGLLDWDAAIDGLPDPVTVRYEDVVSAPEKAQERLGEILGLDYRASVAGFHEAPIPERLAYQLNGVRPVETSHTESWREQPERIKQQFSECPALHDIVIKRGYEKDTEWIRNL